MRMDWEVWQAEVKRLAERPISLTYTALRDAFDLYCEGCTPQEAVSLINHHTILEKDIDAHV